MSASQGAELTIDRLFDAPALAGPSIMNLKVSPDGARVTYLQGKDSDKLRLDLWEYDVASRRSRLLVDADQLRPAGQPLSAEELSRRERQRTAALSGILEYEFSPSGKALLFPVDGRLYYLDLSRDARAQATPLTGGDGFVTDGAVSPHGAYVSFIRDQNLHVHDLQRGTERALTQDGGGVIKNGMAEFVAQEEMDRQTGYWWSPDDSHIAFARVDESPIAVTQRFEISADNVTTFPQRYPAAGSPNARVTLGVVAVDSGAVVWIDLGTNPDIYLARVQWLPDGHTLAIQRQSRDQRHLDLLFADAASGRSRVVLSESSASWIDLHDELTFLHRSREFIWASSRDGYLHLYLYANDGRLLRRLTQGDWVVDDFRHRAIKSVDEKHRRVYFMATAHGATRRDLYVTSLDTRDPAAVHRVTREDGVHAVTMASGGAFYVDRFTSAAQPPQVSLRDLSGKLLAWLQENRLDADHPDAPYAADNAEPEFGTLRAEDGQALHYRVFKPAHMEPGRRYPAVVHVYGGPGVQQVLDQWSGDSFTQVLTRAGFVVFQLDNRGSSSRGTAFQAPLRGALGGVEVRDQVTGARWLGTQAYVDPQRIGVWGWSYGGYMALMLMFRAPEVFSAGVAGAPVTDWTLYDTHYTERYLGSPDDNAAAYAASAVLPYAKELRGRLLVIHGMADDNVLLLHSTKLFRVLQDLGKPFDIMVYPGAKHGLTRQHDGRHAYATILRFFNEHL